MNEYTWKLSKLEDMLISKRPSKAAQNDIIKNVKKAFRQDKKLWIVNLATEAEEIAIIKTWKTLRSHAKNKTKNGKLVTNESEQVIRRREQFMQILNTPSDDTNFCNEQVTNTYETPRISMEETTEKFETEVLKGCAEHTALLVKPILH